MSQRKIKKKFRKLYDPLYNSVHNHLIILPFRSAPREGAYINGLYMEGARWDVNMNTIADAFLKELFPAMPVIFVKAVQKDKQDTKNIYECPVYKIR